MYLINDLRWYKVEGLARINHDQNAIFLLDLNSILLLRKYT